MPILNYTTDIPVERTIGEISGLLVAKGARSIHCEYGDGGKIRAVGFAMLVEGRTVEFLLPNRAAGVYDVMLKDKSRKKSHRGAPTMGQAERVSWRILKDWVAAQLALIESGQAEVAQVFLPYAVVDNGRTMYELFIESNQKRLPAGREK